MSRALVALLVLLLVPACTAAPDEAGAGAAGEEPPADVAWRHVGMVDGMLPGSVTAVVVSEPDDLAGALAATGAADPGEVAWDRELVLLLAQPDDACPDELVGLDEVDGVVRPAWLQPPGGCQQPLIWRIHTVVVHRGHLTGPTTFLVEEPYVQDVAVVTLDLPAYDGEVPPPPEPPRQMAASDLDAVFAGHPVQRCEPLPEAPVGDRAGELEDEADAERIDRVLSWLTRNPRWDTERELVPILDVWGDGEFHIRVAEERADELRADIEAEFGPGVVIVDGVDPSPAELRDAQDALAPLMGGSGPGAIVWSAGAGRRLQVELGMVDVTREALDRVAELVDPRLVCIEPQLTGVVGDGDG